MSLKNILVLIIVIVEIDCFSHPKQKDLIILAEVYPEYHQKLFDSKAIMELNKVKSTELKKVKEFISETYKKKITLYLKLNADEIVVLPKQGRDVKNIGHFGTGDFELTIKNLQDFEETKHLINEAYKNIGG